MATLSNSSLWQTQALINGEWCDADTKKTFPINNPATGEIIAQVADLGIQETRRAIAAAVPAQILWAQKTAKERSQLLRRWFELVMQHQEDLAQILTLEQGKPLA
ncbi:MAG TPA: aldehyde dehydrogenase family protein, partial [Cellvibrio sp.]